MEPNLHAATWKARYIRLTDQLVRLTLHRLRQREDAAGLTRRKALATSPGFSMLLDVRRPGDGPGVDLGRWGSCGIPSTWHSPTTRHPGGNLRQNRRVHRLALPPGCRVVALREVDGMPHPAHPPSRSNFEAGIPEICPPGEGMGLQIDKIFWATKQDA
jgi:hypothetical protein